MDTVCVCVCVCACVRACVHQYQYATSDRAYSSTDAIKYCRVFLYLAVCASYCPVEIL